LTFLYGQDACVANGIPYGNGGNLSDCEDGTTGCDCNDDCGGSAFLDDCGNCVGGNTIYAYNHFMDECGVCGYETPGPGPNVPCWDGSLVCDASDCPFNPGACPSGTVGMAYYLGDNNICVPTDFSSVNQSTKEAHYPFDSVSINGEQVDADDWVGAFNENVCVGAKKWDTSQCNSGICNVPVMGFNNSDLEGEATSGYMMYGESPSFKIFDASENTYYDAVASEDIPWENQQILSIASLNGIINPLSIYDGTLPDTYSIYNIYPNPFNPTTYIDYSLPENASIELFVYNIHGRHIQTLVQDFQTAGYHSINWNAQNYPSGIYLIRLESGKYSETQKVVLIK